MKEDEMGSSCGERNACKILVVKSEGNRLLGRPRRRWDIIKMDLMKIRWRVWTGFI
jgi:hypothetical protein